tara:strand:+ start:365 stop:1519 length:1155 start_codon:yes stop_codon:yes gene_type:complete
MSRIPLSVPSIKGNEWKYLKECLDTEWISSAGKYVDLFEKNISEYTGSKYAIACVNGTSAIQISLQLAGVCPGDEVIVPTLTFIAPVNAIAYNGAIPIFMDADKYYNIDIEKTIHFINKETYFKNGFSYNKSSKNKISAIVPVHVWGNGCLLDELVAICNERNIQIVEDASESLGTSYSEGTYSDNHTGTIGKFGCISFNGNKIISTGGGGMILTDDSMLAEKAKYLTTQAKDDEIKYIHNSIGYNFRLTNIQAALGVAQLESLPEFLIKKKKIFRYYSDGIKEIEGLLIADVPSYCENNHWLNLLQIKKDIYIDDRNHIFSKFEKNNIQTRPVWFLNHMQLPYKNNQNYKIENAINLIENSLCLPSSTNLKTNDMDRVIQQLI